MRIGNYTAITKGQRKNTAEITFQKMFPLAER